MQIQRLTQGKKHKRRISRRLTIFIIAGLSLVIGTVIWISNGNDGGNRWSNVLSIIFVAAGILISLLQWLFPVSADDRHVTMTDHVETLFPAPGKPTLDVEKLSSQYQALALFHALNRLSEAKLIVIATDSELYTAMMQCEEHALQYSLQEAAIYSDLGIISNTLGLKEEAMCYYEKALRLYKGIGDSHGEAKVLNHLASLYENPGPHN